MTCCDNYVVGLVTVVGAQCSPRIDKVSSAAETTAHNWQHVNDGRLLGLFCHFCPAIELFIHVQRVAAAGLTSPVRSGEDMST